MDALHVFSTKVHKALSYFEPIEKGRLRDHIYGGKYSIGWVIVFFEWSDESTTTPYHNESSVEVKKACKDKEIVEVVVYHGANVFKYQVKDTISF